MTSSQWEIVPNASSLNQRSGAQIIKETEESGKQGKAQKQSGDDGKEEGEERTPGPKDLPILVIHSVSAHMVSRGIL